MANASNECGQSRDTSHVHFLYVFEKLCDTQTPGVWFTSITEVGAMTSRYPRIPRVSSEMFAQKGRVSGPCQPLPRGSGYTDRLN